MLVLWMGHSLVSSAHLLSTYCVPGWLAHSRFPLPPTGASGAPTPFRQAPCCLQGVQGERDRRDLCPNILVGRNGVNEDLRCDQARFKMESGKSQKTGLGDDGEGGPP